MRLWMVNPKMLCKRHLLAEHFECHTFAGTILKGKTITGYINNGLLEPGKVKSRHKELVKEMNFRGYNHISELQSFSSEGLPEGKINILENVELLRERCPECKKLIEEIEKCSK